MMINLILLLLYFIKSYSAPLRQQSTISTIAPQPKCLLPCRDAAAREKIEKDYTLDPPSHEQCYWRFRSGDEILTGCLRNKWIVFLGDSELRGITLSLIKQILNNNYKYPTRDKIDLTNRHSAYLNVGGSFDVAKFNLGAMDFLIETDSWTGEIINVHRWSATKNSPEVNTIVSNLKNGRQFCDHTPSGLAFQKMKTIANPSRHWTRITYFFTHWIHEVIDTYLTLITPKQLKGADHLILNGGKWDLFHYTQAELPSKGVQWYTPFGLKKWNKKNAYELYVNDFTKMIKYCESGDFKCVWVTMSWANFIDTTTSQVAATMTLALNQALTSSHHSVRVLDRWFSSIQVGGSDMVDSAHYDNLSNREDLARLMGIMCESFELGKEPLELPPGRLLESRKDGGAFCRVIFDKCMTEGIIFSRRFCAPKILGITGRGTWKYTCQWRTKEFTCEGHNRNEIDVMESLHYAESDGEGTKK